MKLTNPTDAELNAAFAEKVAGYFSNPIFKPQHSWCRKSPTGDIIVLNGLGALPDFTTSADAVLPWLEKELLWNTQGVPGKRYITQVMIEGPPPMGYVEGRDKSFSKSAVIALLRAHGVEVEFI